MEDQITMEELWSYVKGPMFSLTDREKQLGLGSKGITTYFTPNCTQQDSDLVNRFLKSMNIEGYINRVIKVSKGGKDGQDVYEIRHAAADNSTLTETQVFENAEFIVTAGDYAPLMSKVNDNLVLAAKYAANEEEKSMLECYVKSFKEGMFATCY